MRIKFEKINGKGIKFFKSKNEICWFFFLDIYSLRIKLTIDKD